MIKERILNNIINNNETWEKLITKHYISRIWFVLFIVSVLASFIFKPLLILTLFLSIFALVYGIFLLVEMILRIYFFHNYELIIMPWFVSGYLIAGVFK